MDLMSSKFEKENDLMKRELAIGFLQEETTKLEFKEELQSERINNKMQFDNLKKDNAGMKEELKLVIGLLSLQVDYLKVNKI